MHPLQSTGGGQNSRPPLRGRMDVRREHRASTGSEKEIHPDLLRLARKCGGRNEEAEGEETKEEESEEIEEEKLKEEEIKKALRKMKLKKAAGIDRILTEAWKYAGKRLWKKLVSLMKMVWRKGKIPEDWKKSIIVPIYKRGDKEKATNYRGITLLCTAYKLNGWGIEAKEVIYEEEGFEDQLIKREKKSTHPTVISSIIAKTGIPDIQEIKKIGKGKILIELRTALAANRLVDNSTFSKYNLKTFIPAFRVLRVRVIQDVLTEIDLESVLRHIEVPSCKILDIQRFNRRTIIDGKTEYIPSKTLRIIFAGQILPHEVFLFKTRREVRPFIPKPRICFACYRIGHVAKVYARASRNAFIVEAIDMKRKTSALALDMKRMLNASTAKVTI
ncbi:hypothetical protein ALC57_15482 [Trachymyrmex cornetzi]|uniref:Uncharacterized protein n=1 Tax=Trachymyrmex cornetzi TaxID=471704 RepID=A0A151IXE6_9HYME|nr:hypothetical protein ALC57_15482 [Trachymyrmex cornetzi]